MGELRSKGSSYQALATLLYSQRNRKGRWEMSDPRNLGPEARENEGTTGMNSKNMEKTMGMETTKRVWRLMMTPYDKARNWPNPWLFGISSP